MMHIPSPIKIFQAPFATAVTHSGLFVCLNVFSKLVIYLHLHVGMGAR